MPFHDELLKRTEAERRAMLEVPQLQDGLAGRISREAYVQYLTQAYHHVRHTVPLLRLARGRLAHDARLSAALDQYIDEETGHERWVLADIAAAGGDPAAAMHANPAAATEMVAEAYECVLRYRAVGLFGMVLVLEGTSVALATHAADAIQASLGLPDRAFTYLRSHGALDQDHLKFFARLMDGITDRDDQQAIVAMAAKMYGLFSDVFRSIDTGVRHAVA